MRRPPLIPTLAAVAAFGLTVSLGQWQLRRADEKAALQSARDAALAAPPTALATVPVADAGLDGRRVSATGVLDDRWTLFLDNRTRQGIAGFHVVTPLRLERTDRHVLVLRGWVARDLADRTRVPRVPVPSGTVTVEGFAIAELPQPIVLGEVREPTGAPIRQRLDTDAFARESGLRLLPILIRQTSDSGDGLARDWVQPGSGVDRHRGYAFQWFAMAAAIAALWLWFAVVNDRRPER